MGLNPRALALLGEHAPRLALKAGFFALGLFLLFKVCLPAQQQAWGLWLDSQQLARDTAFGVVVGSALIITLTGYSWASGQWLRGALGAVAALGLFTTSLLGLWNFYLYEGRTNVLAAVVDAGSNEAAARTSALDAELALRLSEVASTERSTLETIDAALAATTSAQSLTRRTLTAQRLEAVETAREERATIRADIERRRAAAPQAASASAKAEADRRPADAEIAAVFGAATLEGRQTVASLLDLKRSALFEILLLAFAPLALSGAPLPRAKRAESNDVMRDLLDALRERPAPPTPPDTPVNPPSPQPGVGGGIPEGAAPAGAGQPPGPLPQPAPDVALLDEPPQPPEPPLPPPPKPPRPPKLKALPPATAEERARLIKEIALA